MGGVESTDKSSTIGIIAGLSTACVVLLVCVGALIAGILLYRKKQNPSTKNKPLDSNPQPTEYYNVALNTTEDQLSTDYAEINLQTIPPNALQPANTTHTDIQVLQTEGQNTVTASSSDYYNISMPNATTDQQSQENDYESTASVSTEGAVQNVYQPLQGGELQRGFDYENLAIESDYMTN